MIKNFNKPAKSNVALINLLEQRGLYIQDKATAAAKLRTIGYYRFSAYFKPFLRSSQSQHQFINNIGFDVLWDLHSFDSELRSLVYEGLEKIELAFLGSYQF